MKAFWTWIKSNPYFVAGWTAFVGALLPQLNSLQQGKIDFSTGGIEHSLISAGSVGLIAVVHLYTNTPQQAKYKAAMQNNSPTRELIGMPNPPAAK